MCKYCNLEDAKKPFGITINNPTRIKAEDARLYICYDDCTYDELPHYQIRTAKNHVDASVEINYCPFCGRRL